MYTLAFPRPEETRADQDLKKQNEILKVINKKFFSTMGLRHKVNVGRQKATYYGEDDSTRHLPLGGERENRIMIYSLHNAHIQ